jgi:peptidyl-prolyl cis-trans isomerase SurA
MNMICKRLAMMGLLAACFCTPALQAETGGMFGWLQAKAKPANQNSAVKKTAKVLPKAADQHPDPMGKTLVDAILVQVGTGLVTLYDVSLEKKIIALNWSVSHPKQAMPQDDRLNEQIVQHLIDRRIIEQTADQKNITIDNKAVQSAVNRWFKTVDWSRKKLLTALSEKGLSWLNFKQMVRSELLYQKVLAISLGPEIVISQDSVDAYQKKHNQARLYVTVEAVHVAVKEGASKQAQEKARAKLLALAAKDPKHWQLNDESDLVVSHWDKQPLSSLPSVFADWIARHPKDVLVGPIKTGNGYHLLYVSSRESKGGALSLADIKQRLFSQALGKKTSGWLKQLRSSFWIYRVR